MIKFYIIFQIVMRAIGLLAAPQQMFEVPHHRIQCSRPYGQLRARLVAAIPRPTGKSRPSRAKIPFGRHNVITRSQAAVLNIGAFIGR